MNKTLCFIGLALFSLSGHASCHLSSSNLYFDGYDPSSSVANTTIADLQIDCDVPTSFSIELDAGQNSAGFQQRRMAHDSRSGEYLNYILSQDSAYTHSWGQINLGAARSVTVNQTARLNIYGAIPAGQQPWVGHYSDRVTLTILP